MKKLSSLLSKIKKDYMCISRFKNNWTRSYKEACKFIRFVNGMSLQYSKILNCSQEEVLETLEKNRTYWSANYYQRANFPKLKKKNNVDIFETSNDFKNKFPSGKYICPACNGISTSASICDSGKYINSIKICDWKSFGFFGTLGRGYSFIIKDTFLKEPIVYNIFKPLELDNKNEKN